jgi:hypothetical protein
MKNKIKPAKVTKEESPKIVTYAKYFAGLILLVILYMFYAKSSESSSDVFEILASQANNTNKNCPYPVTQDSRLDSVHAPGGKKFEYHFTLNTFDRKNVDLDSMEDAGKIRIIENLKRNPEMKLFIDNKVDLLYLYKDKDGKKLFDIKLNAAKVAK